MLWIRCELLGVLHMCNLLSCSIGVAKTSFRVFLLWRRVRCRWCERRYSVQQLLFREVVRRLPQNESGPGKNHRAVQNLYPGVHLTWRGSVLVRIRLLLCVGQMRTIAIRPHTGRQSGAPIRETRRNGYASHRSRGAAMSAKIQRVFMIP